MKIAIFGLGIIGGAWAKNLQADKHEVRCWNRTKKDFPGFEPDAARAADGADFLIIIVADPPAVQKVLDLIAPKLKQGQVVVQSSTISAEWSKKFAQQVEKTGAQFLEAPFTGSKPAAEKRETVYYVGGDAKVLEKSRPVLERLGKTFLHVGPVGSASSLKLAMNMNLAEVSQALCESFAFAMDQGVSKEIFFKALEANAGWSKLAEFQLPMLLKEEFPPNFTLKNMDKDLRLALESAGNLSLAQARALKKTYDEAMSHGWQNENYNVLYRLIRKNTVQNKSQ